jgi:RNA polymerase sigma factor (sigma-70 family)
VRTAASDQQLLEGLANNDSEAVETLYRQHYQMVLSLITNNSGYPEDARDIFQEVMIVLYEKVRSGPFSLNCQLKTYLYSVSRRLWLKRLSQLQRKAPGNGKTEETVPVEEDLEMYEQRNIDFHIMEKAMNNLGEPCRSLLEAYYLRKKTMVEIASGFGYTNADNAKNQKYKCLMRLKKIFSTIKN